jgi:hypothetical protein
LGRIHGGAVQGNQWAVTVGRQLKMIKPAGRDPAGVPHWLRTEYLARHIVGSVSHQQVSKAVHLHTQVSQLLNWSM